MSSSNVSAPAAAKQNQGPVSISNQNSTMQINTTYADASALYEKGQSPFEETLTVHPSVVNMHDLAIEMESFIRRHCVLSDPEIHAIVLWVVSSYLINSFRIFPKLTLISPEKRCGKSTTLEVIYSLSRDGMMMSNVSQAYIYRITEFFQPTMLIDETDTFINSGNLALNGLINSSHLKSGSKIGRCGPDEFKPKLFSTWMAMIMASIGDLPATIMDRAIPISLRRKKASEIVSRVSATATEDNKIIREKITRWCLDNQAAVKSSTVSPLSRGNDRAVDNWIPLFIVASLISDTWESKCNDAYNALVSISEPELPTQLLQDTQQIFKDRTDKRIGSSELVTALNSDPEKPWSQCMDGRKLTPYTMAKMLRPFGIKSRSIRFPSGVVRGYKASDFEDAFARYLNQP